MSEALREGQTRRDRERERGGGRERERGRERGGGWKGRHEQNNRRINRKTTKGGRESETK